MHFTGQGAYDLAPTAVDQHCVVMLVPAKWGDRKAMYMHYFQPTDHATRQLEAMTDTQRAEFAIRMCHVSRDKAAKRGFTLDAV